MSPSLTHFTSNKWMSCCCCFSTLALALDAQKDHKMILILAIAIAFCSEKLNLHSARILHLWNASAHNMCTMYTSHGSHRCMECILSGIASATAVAAYMYTKYKYVRRCTECTEMPQRMRHLYIVSAQRSNFWSQIVKLWGSCFSAVREKLLPI